MLNAFKIGSLALLGFIAFCQTSEASVIGVTTRSGIGADDSISWGQLGPSGTTVSNPASVNSANGLSIAVSIPSGNMTRLDQSTGFNGNFASGDQLLFTGFASSGFNPGPLSLDFSTPIRGGGAQIQENYYGNFTAAIYAFDINNVLLGSFTENGISNGFANNSAIFIGLLSDTADIARLSFDITYTQFGTDNFVINEVSLATVPEPTTLPLLCTGLGLMGLFGWSRQRRVVAAS